MMNYKNYKIADVCFSMECQYDLTEKLCADYEVDEKHLPEFEIFVSEQEIEKEAQNNDGNFKRGYLESLALYRKLCEKMLDYDTYLFHCSAVEVEGRSYLFAAPSGTGKSTHTGLWREYFGEKAIMINDDKPLLRIHDGEIFVCGTPWSGKHRLETNKISPVQGICILERGTENRIRKISPLEAYPGLYRQTYRPKDKEKMVKTLELLKKVAEKTPLYQMKCTISQEAVKMAWDAMKP